MSKSTNPRKVFALFHIKSLIDRTVFLSVKFIGGMLPDSFDVY